MLVNIRPVAPDVTLFGMKTTAFVSYFAKEVLAAAASAAGIIPAVPKN